MQRHIRTRSIAAFIERNALVSADSFGPPQTFNRVPDCHRTAIRLPQGSALLRRDPDSGPHPHLPARARGQHLIVLRDGGAAVAYAGWAACEAADGQRFLGEQRIAALDFGRREGEAIAFLSWTAADAAAMTALETAMRALHPGTRYFARRSHAAAEGAAPRRVLPRGGVITALAARSIAA